MFKNNELDNQLDIILAIPLIKATISNPVKKTEAKYKRIQISRKLIKNTEAYQIEKFTDKQVFHQNVNASELKECILKDLEVYKQINIMSEGSSFEIKFNKDRDFIINKSKNEINNGNTLSSNNRKKDYILKEGTNIPVFVELGIFTKEYKVVNSKYDKFKQINRFVEMMDDMLKDYHKEEINIIDFGCGKSYLTFIVYYYMTQIKKIKANIVGIDLKADVIMHCNELSDKFNYSNLKFVVGDINGYRAPFAVDMVISLHACDTATDYALYNAITWNSEMIMSVPCCQHEINAQITSDDLCALIKYGIIKERTSALITDALRGCMLESEGYKTDLLEFIDIEHSPKNILIRARKKNVSKDKREKSYQEARRLSEAFGLNQTLMKLLEEKNGASKMKYVKRD